MSKEFKILELRFSNMKCFGEKNCIDFRKNVDNLNAVLVAKNSYGKTAISLSIIFCLYGKKIGQPFNIPHNFPKKRSNTDFVKYIINKDIIDKDKTEFDCSLLFTVDNETYLIRRTSTLKYDNVKAMLYKINGDKRKLITDPLDSSNSSNKYTNTCIEKLVGSYENFLMISSCVHDASANFVKLSAQQRYLYLLSMMNYKEINKYVSSIESFVNNLLDQCFNDKKLSFHVDLKTGIEIGVVDKKKGYYYHDILNFGDYGMWCSNIAIKYAFMKLLPCDKINLLLMDFDLREDSYFHSNYELFDGVFKKIKNNGIDIFLLTSCSKFKNNKNFVLGIERKDRDSSINNTGKIKHNRIYAKEVGYNMIDDESSYEADNGFSSYESNDGSSSYESSNDDSSYENDSIESF